MQALAGTGAGAVGIAGAAPVTTPPGWELETTRAVEASIERGRAAGLVVPAVLERAGGVAAASVLQEHARQVQARAIAAGSLGYIWHTQRDGRVRPGHRALEGTQQRWESPPITDPATGYRAHPGEPKACRCVPWPLLRIRTAPAPTGTDES